MIQTNEIFISKKVWNNFSDDELERYVHNVFEYYRTNGFPYFSTNNDYRLNELNKFLNVDYMKLFDGNIIKQHMAGLSYCWSFMPHSYEIKCNNMKTPLEVFNDDCLLLKVIKKRIKMGDNMSDNGLRKMLKIFTGTQCVSNFRPTASAIIYELYGKGKVVWDMSAGFGGRLLGAYRAGVSKYIGTEPCTKTYNGLCEIIDNLKFNNNAVIYKIGSEMFKPEPNSIDLCFTSPPYFDTEKYSDEDTQSYKRFNDKDGWLNGFLKTTFENCLYGLKNGGIMVINIANVKSYPNLETDCVTVANNIGFILEDVLKYSLSSLSHRDKFKYEPIFIFRKP